MLLRMNIIIKDKDLLLALHTQINLYNNIYKLIIFYSYLNLHLKLFQILTILFFYITKIIKMYT